MRLYSRLEDERLQTARRLGVLSHSMTRRISKQINYNPTPRRIRIPCAYAQCTLYSSSLELTYGLPCQSQSRNKTSSCTIKFVSQVRITEYGLGLSDPTQAVHVYICALPRWLNLDLEYFIQSVRVPFTVQDPLAPLKKKNKSKVGIPERHASALQNKTIAVTEKIHKTTKPR